MALDPGPKSRNDRTTRAGWVMAGASWQFVTEVLAGTLIGWGIDWYFSTKPWGIVIGAVCGFLVGMWSFIRRTLALERSLGPVQRPPGGWKGEKEKKDAHDEEDGEDRPRDERP